MTHLPKLKLLYSSLKYPIHRNKNFSCYRLFGSGESGRKSPVTVKKKVEAALLEYLLCTRTLNFTDTEHMSKNSPHFVKKLIEKVGNESDDVKRSVARFLNYHPINEFEPFFESIGLEPSEFDAFLPRNLMFLSDEVGLLDNYHVLCKYGIARVQMGKIYREAREVFRYDKGVLQSKLQGFEQPGNCQLFHKVNSGPVLNLKHASEPRLLRTAAGQIENCCTGSIPKHLVYIAFRLKRGIKF